MQQLSLPEKIWRRRQPAVAHAPQWQLSFGRHSSGAGPGADSAPSLGFSSMPSLRLTVDAQPFRAKPVPAFVKKVKPVSPSDIQANTEDDSRVTLQKL